MPNRDKTGPNGNGPKTGRGNGECSGNPKREISKGRGRGRNRK